MLELKPEGPLSWSFDIVRNNATVGRLELRRIKPAGTIHIDGETYELAREGLFGPFLLNKGERTIGRAERAALIVPRYRMTVEDRQLFLTSKGFLMRMAQLYHGDVSIATISRTSMFRRGVYVDETEGAPLPAVLFAACLMILFWRHQSRSSS